MHGGPNSVAGPASNLYRHGNISRYMPRRLLSDYEASLANPDRLELSAQLAIVDARLAELLRGLDKDAPEAGFVDLPRKWDQMERAQHAGKDDTVADLYAEIKAAVSTMARLQATWAELYDVIDRRRKVVESERRRLLESAEMLSLAQALSIINRMQEAVYENVKDRDTLAAIGQSWARVIGPTDRAGSARELEAPR